jgi:nucleoside-diphosphate kinase
MAIERTLILFKPDAVQRQLCGKILSRLEERGLKIIGLKMLQITKELSAKHYAEHVSKPFYPLLESFIISGPVIAVVAEGPQAIEVVRGMMGKTNSRDSAPGTIRGDYGISRQMNLIHGSDGPEAAARELKIYFQDSEICSYTLPHEGLLFADDER